MREPEHMHVLEQLQQKCAAVLRPELHKSKRIDLFRDPEKSRKDPEHDPERWETVSRKSCTGPKPAGLKAKRALKA
ncbi:MAG: hypothetical protein WBA88_12800 [Pseudaminobacter sp.]